MSRQDQNRNASNGRNGSRPAKHLHAGSARFPQSVSESRHSVLGQKRLSGWTNAEFCLGPIPEAPPAVSEGRSRFQSGLR